MKQQYYKKDITYKIKLNKDIMRLFGYYLAEGSCGNRTIKFSFNLKETEFINDVKSIMMKNFNLKASEWKYPKSHSYEMEFYDVKLVRLIKKLFSTGCKTKNIDEKILNIKKDMLLELLIGFIKGDGYIRKSNKKGNGGEIVLTSISTELIDDLSFILIKLGIPHTFSYTDLSRIYISPCYAKKILSRFSIKEFTAGNGHIKVNKNFIFPKIKKIRKIKYGKNTYNLEVGLNNTYIAEHIIVHNCVENKTNEIIQHMFINDDVRRDLI
jgi:intein/homing endonuclease